MPGSEKAKLGDLNLQQQAEFGLVGRREFLKKSVLAGLGVAAVYIAPQITSITSKPAYAAVTGVCVPEYHLSWGKKTRRIRPFNYNGTVQQFYNHHGFQGTRQVRLSMTIAPTHRGTSSKWTIQTSRQTEG